MKVWLMAPIKHNKVKDGINILSIMFTGKNAVGYGKGPFDVIIDGRACGKISDNLDDYSFLIEVPINEQSHQVHVRSCGLIKTDYPGTIVPAGKGDVEVRIDVAKQFAAEVAKIEQPSNLNIEDSTTTWALAMNLLERFDLDGSYYLRLKQNKWTWFCYLNVGYTSVTVEYYEISRYKGNPYAKESVTYELPYAHFHADADSWTKDEYDKLDRMADQDRLREFLLGKLSHYPHLNIVVADGKQCIQDAYKDYSVF